MEEYEQAPQIKSSPYLSPMHQYGSSIILLTNPQSLMEEMELAFRSIKKDERGNLIEVGEPLMNEYGIRNVIGTVQSIVNQVTVMGNLKKEEIQMMVDFIGDTLAKDLMINRTTYAIRSYTARDKIYFTALATSFLTMKRAFEEGDRRFWKGSVQEIRSTVDNQNRKPGLLSALNPFK